MTGDTCGNPISLSIAPANNAAGKRFHDLSASIELMKSLEGDGVVDGFELQLLEEWDRDAPPLDDGEKRRASWGESAKHTTGEVAQRIAEAGVRILSVHAKRDIGIYLCSADPGRREKGSRLIGETLGFARSIGCPVCVFHLWDTWKPELDISFLQEALAEASARYAGIHASVENVPTHVEGLTPFGIVRRFPCVTLDLQWAAMYDELEKFEEIKDRIVNVHLRGRLESSRWALPNSSPGFYESLGLIKRQWRYSGPLTMEPNGLRPGNWEELLAAMGSLRAF